MKKYLVMGDLFLGDGTNLSNSVYYCGEVEFEALKRYKQVKTSNKKMVIADVTRTKLMGFDFIKDYKILEVLKG